MSMLQSCRSAFKAVHRRTSGGKVTSSPATLGLPPLPSPEQQRRLAIMLQDPALCLIRSSLLRVLALYDEAALSSLLQRTALPVEQAIITECYTYLHIMRTHDFKQHI